MQTKNVTEIRSLGFTKVNQLVRAARHIEELRPAFAEWEEGEVFVCKKNGCYRYRCGERSKTETPWSKIAQSLFPSAAAFAFAAMVLAPERKVEAVTAAPATEVNGKSHRPTGRVNIIALATAA